MWPEQASYRKTEKEAVEREFPTTWLDWFKPVGVVLFAVTTFVVAKVVVNLLRGH